jgi:8-oxo-dGTP pyrophosphatase MutT (NUDIX family)
VRFAATIMLFRDSDAGPEVLMLRRNLNSDFVGGAFVFPGGAIDPDDSDNDLAAGLSDLDASRVLGVTNGGLSFYIGALRELFEEAGVLLAVGAGPSVTERATLRHELLAGGSFGALLRASRVELAVDALHYFAHWVTPVGPPRRYDTRFFVARAPEHQEASHDQGETIADTWITPRAALEGVRAGTFDMIFPTIKNLEAVADFSSVDDILAYAQSPRTIPMIQPRLVERDGTTVIVMPDDEA